MNFSYDETAVEVTPQRLAIRIWARAFHAPKHVSRGVGGVVPYHITPLFYGAAEDVSPVTQLQLLPAALEMMPLPPNDESHDTNVAT